MKKIIGFALKLGVTVGLFVLLFWPQTFGLAPDRFGGIKPGDLWREIQGSQASHIFFWLGFALIVKLGGMLCGVLRWRILLRGQGIPMPFWYTVSSWFVGRTIGIFLPGTIGLDGYRLYDSSRYTGEVIKCTTVIVIEKLIGFIALTGLVFLTFPLGFRLLSIRLPVLAVILFILASAVMVFLLLLLNPRVIQVLVAVIPTPGFVRNKLNKLGAAATAYSGSRRDLLLAVFFGFMVHVGTCFMFFGTMMAIRAQNTSLYDILFASPLMIYGTVLGPSVGGEGIREIVFVSLLSVKSGAAAAATFAHLGWWIGELVPFLIGLPIYVFRTRPGRAQLEAELAATRRAAAESQPDTLLHLAPNVVSEYRRQVFAAIASGLLGGLIAGAVIGLCEAAWLLKTLAGLTEMGMFTWGPAVYGFIFAGVGIGIAFALLFLYLLADRFASWAFTFAASLSGSLAAGGTVIGLWRLMRDVHGGHLPPKTEAVQLIMYVLGSALIVLALSYVLARLKSWFLRENRWVLLAAGVATYAVLVLIGAVFGVKNVPAVSASKFNPPVQAAGPNIILVAVDALRADYLRFYNPSAEAATPALDAFARDAVLFEKSFSHASWTKPSFATLFTGLYPESHTATDKTSALPEDIDTLAELLSAGGYYCKGFANNPNVWTLFRFNQGFADYTDLKPNLYFGASASASKLAMYEVLRKVRQRLAQRLRFIPGVGGMSVTDFYQPAEVVTRSALDWLDGRAAPAGTPFYLYLHYMETHDPFMDHDRPGVGYARSVMKDHPDPVYEGPMRHAYNTEIEYLDKHLGILFDGLKQRGLYDNTLIVFTSDHGEEFYDHRGWWHGFTLYDEMIHVPIVLKLPRNAHAGERNPGMARHIDLPPTILHFARLPKGSRMAGQSLYDDHEAVNNVAIIHSYAHNDFEGNAVHAVRSAADKLITANQDNVSHLAPVEFYDMDRDPREKQNLTGEAAYSEREASLRKAMQEYSEIIKGRTVAPASRIPLTGDAAQQLGALGYLQ